jgi:hypothetical protein
VGSNLISSAVLEMCDFIRVENIKSLLEYIVTKHLSKPTSPEEESLEDIANPYVDTFAQLRRAHEENMGVHHDLNEAGHQGPNNDGTTFSGRPAPVLNKRALEDQVSKFPGCSFYCEDSSCQFTHASFSFLYTFLYSVNFERLNPKIPTLMMTMMTKR